MTSCYTGPKPFKRKCPWQIDRTCLLCHKPLLGLLRQVKTCMTYKCRKLFTYVELLNCLFDVPSCVKTDDEKNQLSSFLGTVPLVWMITLRLYRVSTRISAYLILLSIKSHHLFRFHLKYIDKVRYQAVWPSDKAIIFFKR